MSDVAFAISNLAIFVGYLFIAFVITPNIEVRLLITKIGGFFFFLTCGLTHMELAVHSFIEGGLRRRELLAGHMIAIHAVQAVSVWMFVIGLYAEFVRPTIRPKSQPGNRT